MRVCANLLGPLREVTSSREVIVDLPEACSVRDLYVRLKELFPGVEVYGQHTETDLNPETYISAAIDGFLSDFTAILHEGNTVTFFTAISGG